MIDEVKPKVWVGGHEPANAWAWESLMKWFTVPVLIDTDIFVPGCEPKPTIDPSKMKTIETCCKVDWQ